MATALIIYGSTTGNTESTARLIAETITQRDFTVTVKDVSAVALSDFDQAYDLLVLGSSTWGDEEIELQDDFADFYDEMDKLNLKGRKAAVFGCGDSSYTHFCGAVDALEEKAEKLGAELVAAGLKIDGDPDDSEGEIKEWAAGAAAAV